MNVLSIHSHVAYGHVGNAAATLPLQLMGFEVWEVHTVAFSNHPGYGDRRGLVLDADHVAAILEGVGERGAYARCDAILSGYLGDPDTGPVVLDAVERVRAANPTALYCCDPVIGDSDRGVYVPDGVAGFLRECAIPPASIVTPNQFELSALTGMSVDDLDSALAAVDVIRAAGPRIVLVTGLRRRDGRGDRIEMLAVSPEGGWLVATPML
ncbi:MAG: pyridoxal kinase, partial [Alphaproteobacteria bacterium]